MRRILLYFSYQANSGNNLDTFFIIRGKGSMSYPVKCPALFTESHFLYFHLRSSFLVLKDCGDKKAGKTYKFQQSSWFQKDNIGLNITVHKSEVFQEFCHKLMLFFCLQLIRRYYLQDIKHPLIWLQHLGSNLTITQL